MSKKSSGGSTLYYGTLAAVIGRGPLYGLHSILLNSEVAWSGPIYRASTTNPVNLTTDEGTIRLYWGTEDQSADPTLNRYEQHPPYRGVAYVVFDDYNFGQTTTAPNVEFIPCAAPQQSLITGLVAAESLYQARNVNSIVAAADILTSETNLGLPAELFDAASAQAVAEAVQVSDPISSAVSPLYDEQIEARAAVAELTAWSGAWLRYSPAGQIEFGRWRTDSAPTSVTALSHADLTEAPTITPPDASEVPNSFAVNFTDAADLCKTAKIPVDDPAALAAPGAVLRRQTLDAQFLTSISSAERGGREALRRARAEASWSCRVRATKARIPTGERIRPGDYLRVPITHPRASTQITRLLRVTRTVWPGDGHSAVEISGTLDPGAAPEYTVEEPTPTVGRGIVMPPINYSRVLPLPPAAADESPAIYVLAARPHDLALGINVYYDDTAPLGDYPLVGRQTAFALPVLLAADLAAGSSTVSFSLIGTTESGVSRQRDKGMVTGWSGGLTEGRNDELLLILVRRAADGSIAPNGDRDWVEVLSIASAPALTSEDTYSVDVLRGRLNTLALAHLGSDTEGWIIYRSRLDPLSHADFDSMLTSGAWGYFRLGAYAARASYSPALARAEKMARAETGEAFAEFAIQENDTDWFPPLAGVRIPSGYAVETVIDAGAL